MKSLLILPALLGIAVAAQAQRYDDDRRPFDRDRGYSDRGQRDEPVERAVSDLRRTRTAWFDHHDQHHLDKAVSELYKFENELRRGHWDGDHLDRAIDNMKHVANADRVPPRDRDIIYGDIMALRDFRASRGGDRDRRYQEDGYRR